MVSAAPVDSYGLALPAVWRRIPLDREGFERFVGNQRRQLAETGELSRTAQRRFEVLLRQLRNDCARHGVVLVAVYAATAGSSPDRAQVELLAATCTLATLDQPRLGTSLPLTANTLLAAAARGNSGADVEPPVIVDLPGGRAVRLVRRQRIGQVQADEREVDGVDVLAEHYLLPHGDGRRAALLSLATPNVECGDAMRALFRELANTLRTFAGDAPTDVRGATG